MTSPSRLAFAASHVVMRPEYRGVDHAPDRPGAPDEIEEFVDWSATMALRSRLDGFGLGIAEAMDTAQRFEIGWSTAEQLIRRCGALGLRHGFVAGAGSDHRVVGSNSELIDAVVEQVGIIQSVGGIAVLLPMNWLITSGASESDYVDVYTAIIDEVDGPLVVHWLGEMFAADLAGYFPGDSFRRIMAHDPAKVRGCKLSLLDAQFELKVRRELLPRDQVVMTGDDFNFAALIRGGDPSLALEEAPEIERMSTLGDLPLALGDFSHALLGVLDGIPNVAGRALQQLSAGDAAEFMRLMVPCEELGRHVFMSPTQNYKAGLAFLTWLNGLQDEFMLVNHQERSRSLEHYELAFGLASAAGILEDASLARERLESLRAAT